MNARSSLTRILSLCKLNIDDGILFSLVYVYVIHLLPHYLSTVELISLWKHNLEVPSNLEQQLLMNLNDALLMHGIPLARARPVRILLAFLGNCTILITYLTLRQCLILYLRIDVWQFMLGYLSFSSDLAFSTSLLALS